MDPLACAKLRRMVVSANRSHWLSACELAIFYITGGHCVHTHHTREVFPGRAHYLMNECRRLLNGETHQADPMLASCTEVVDVAAMAPALRAATEAGSEAKDRFAHANVGGLGAGGKRRGQGQ